MGAVHSTKTNHVFDASVSQYQQHREIVCFVAIIHRQLYNLRGSIYYFREYSGTFAQLVTMQKSATQNATIPDIVTLRREL